MSWSLELAVVVGLTLLNGVFSAAEIAVISIRATRVAELAGQSARGRHLALLRSDPERFLAIVQIGVTVVGATTAAFGGATWAGQTAALLEDAGLGAEPARHVALVVVVVAVSYFSLVLGELVPKSLGLKWSERYALAVARPLYLLGRVGAPIVSLLTASSNLLLRAFGDRTSFVETEVSRDELLGVIRRASQVGEVSHRAADVASRAIGVDQLHVRSVMMPRAALVAIEANATGEELVALIEGTEEERFAVRRGEEIIGYVTMRDLARSLACGPGPAIADVARPLPSVPPDALSLDVLEMLQRDRVHMARVVSESGELEGVVDIDDLAEELVGSLLVGPRHEDVRVVREPDGAVVVPAAMRVYVANRLLGIDLPTSVRWSTLGGLLLARTGARPTVGLTTEPAAGVILEAAEVVGGRLTRIRVRRSPPSGERNPAGGPSEP